mmetsp:Transcript_44468/g.71225  ORF Transcript_44468/g.71225 Transcript_44468/m.71225 type:complete len:266 (+) Transcript_44468:72-869(+)
MCFTQTESFVLICVGIALSCLLWPTWPHGDDKHHTRLFFIGVISYYVLMELLQFLTYFVVADSLHDDANCNNIWNQVLTVLGIVHIAFQPFVNNFCLLDTVSSEERIGYKYIARLSFVGALYFLSSFVTVYWFDEVYLTKQAYPKTDWLRGDRVCAYKDSSMLHFGWSLPMHSSTYFTPNTGLHAFMMFAPFFIRKSSVLNGLAMLLLGPVLAMYFTDNIHSQPAIWCFISPLQILLGSTPRLYKHYIKPRLAGAAAASHKPKKH